MQRGVADRETQRPRGQYSAIRMQILRLCSALALALSLSLVSYY